MTEQVGGKGSRPWLYDDLDEELLSLDPRWSARRRVAAHLRKLGRTVVGGDLDDEALSCLEAQLGEIAITLGHAPTIRSRSAYMQATGLSGPRNRLALEMSSVSGRSNAASIPMRLFRDAEGLTCAQVEPDWTHEGPPGYLHGGLIAALFDEFLGLAQDNLPGSPGLTGTLMLRYYRPTPLSRPIILSVGSLQQDGRKRFLKGEMHSDGQLTASADATFVQPRQPT